MKRKMIFGIALLTSIALYTSAQKSSIAVLNTLEKGDTLDIVSTASSSEVDSLLKSSKSSKNDTTRIMFGKKALIIVDKGDDTSVWFQKYDWKNNKADSSSLHSKKHKKKGFDPHWAGVELGVNGLMMSDHSTNLKGDAAMLNLNMSKSINFNLNFLEYGIPLAKQYVGLVTGMGLEYNNYRFESDITLKKENGRIVPDSSYIKNGVNLFKSKLTTVYLTVPLLMEFQVPAGDSKVFLSGGVIGGLKLGSHTKVVYDRDGDKQKDKNRNDFYLATLRYGIHASVGYKFIKLYTTYYPVALFQQDKGPEVYPFNVGLVLLDF